MIKFSNEFFTLALFIVSSILIPGFSHAMWLAFKITSIAKSLEALKAEEFWKIEQAIANSTKAVDELTRFMREFQQYVKIRDQFLAKMSQDQNS